MSNQRYPEEFKIEAVKQISERGYPVAEVASRLGVSQHSLYVWLKQYSLPADQRQEAQGQAAEIRRLKAELKRVTEERDNNKAHIKFSTRVPGLADNKFDRLIGAGYITVKREKEVDTFYEIANTFRPSVRRLLTDNYPDSSMRKFFAFLR